MRSRLPFVAVSLTLATLVGTLASCGGGSADVTPPAPEEPKKVEGLQPPPEGPLPTLMISQAQFTKEGGRPVPGPAKVVLLKTDGKTWYQEKLEDPSSNVFHKAIAWREGILTIGAEKARLVHWKKQEGSWAPTVLWEREWGGKFDRMRDLEVGDVTGDGKEDIVIATHDQGVVAVGEEGPTMWSFHELDQAADTFVHEIEIGDVDGNGRLEFYATPSGRNRASGESQPGGVARYEYKDGAFARVLLVQWEESHAKEILVHDVDGDGKQELYAVREAHTEKGADGKPEIKDPVRIVRLEPAAEGEAWKETTVATLPDRQCRFLVPGDVDGDGKKELVAAGWKTGLYLLKPKGDGTYETSLVDADSTGFEHATHLADLDKDGKIEVYVAADDQKAVRRYVWDGTKLAREDVAPIPENHISWNIQDATL